MLPNPVNNSDLVIMPLGIGIWKRRSDFFKYNYSTFDPSKRDTYIYNHALSFMYFDINAYEEP